MPLVRREESVEWSQAPDLGGDAPGSRHVFASATGAGGAAAMRLRLQLREDIDAMLVDRFEQLTEHIDLLIGKRRASGHGAVDLAIHGPSRGSAQAKVDAMFPQAPTRQSGLTTRASANHRSSRASGHVMRVGGEQRPVRTSVLQQGIREECEAVEKWTTSRTAVTRSLEDEEKEAREKAKAEGAKNREKLRKTKTAISDEMEQKFAASLWLRTQRRLQNFIELPMFDLVFALLIISNSIFIGIQVQYNADQSAEITPVEFYVVQCTYAFLFTVELILRILASGQGFFYNTSGLAWNWFDFIVVTMSVVELGFQAATVGRQSEEVIRNMSLARVFRIVRIARVIRVIRIVRFLRSLRVLIYAIFHTLRSCFWALVLFWMVLYVFGIVFTQAATDHRAEMSDAYVPSAVDNKLREFYGSLPRAIFTLYKSMCGGLSWHEAVYPLSDMGSLYVGCFVSFIAFVYFAMMNVVTGLFCQSAIESAQHDQQDLIQEQLQEKERYIKLVQALFEEMDESNDGSITFDEFEVHLNDERMKAFFKTIDIDFSDAWTLFKLLDADGEGSVEVQEFVDGCLSMRGSAKGIQIGKVMYEIKWMMTEMTGIQVMVQEYFDEVLMHLKALRKGSGKNDDHNGHGGQRPGHGQGDLRGHRDDDDHGIGSQGNKNEPSSRDDASQPATDNKKAVRVTTEDV